MAVRSARAGLSIAQAALRRLSSAPSLRREVHVPGMTLVLSTISIITALTAVPLEPAYAQMRRSPGPDGGPPPPPHGTPRNARLPFAGVWDGSFTLGNTPDGARTIPVVMVFVITDSAKAQYGGATILPNGARAPHLETTSTKGTISWKQTNSGGGFWVYAARMVSADSIAGTVVLADWPQLPAGEKPPTGTIALARRPAGK